MRDTEVWRERGRKTSSVGSEVEDQLKTSLEEELAEPIVERA
jgi:hypothetical protein